MAGQNILRPAEGQSLDLDRKWNDQAGKYESCLSVSAQGSYMGVPDQVWIALSPNPVTEDSKLAYSGITENDGYILPLVWKQLVKLLAESLQWICINFNNNFFSIETYLSI